MTWQREGAEAGYCFGLMPQSTDFGGATQPDFMTCLLQKWFLIILIDDTHRSPMEQAECFEMEFFRDFFRFTKFKWPFIVDLPIAELDLPMVCKARRAHHRDPPAQQLSPTGLRWSSLPPPPQRAWRCQTNSDGFIENGWKWKWPFIVDLSLKMDEHGHL